MIADQENIEEQKKLIDEVNFRVWHLRGVPDANEDPMIIGAQMLEKAIAIDYSFGRAQCLLNIGMGSFIINNDPALAIRQINEAFAIFKEVGDRKWIANSYITLGIINNTIGKTEEALYNALRGISFFESEGGDMHDRIMAYYILGTIYKDLKKYEEAEKNYKLGISDPKAAGLMWSGRIFLGLAGIYTIQENYDPAIQMNLKGLEILKNQANTIGESRALTDLGIIYKRKKNYPEALRYLQEGLKIRENHRISRFVLSSLIEIASLFSETGDDDQALIYLKRAEVLANEINFPLKLEEVYRAIGNIYKLKEDYKQALEYYEKLMALSATLRQNETETKITALTADLIKEKEAEIERIKNVELKAAYDIIELKNKEILDSITYAKRLQDAILPADNFVNSFLPDNFIVYTPKDIVAGDFYWMEVVTQAGNSPAGNQDVVLFAAADSTGHGVPGAMVSLVCSNALNRSVKEFGLSIPGQILDKSRELVLETFSKSNSDVKDGMDVSLLSIDKKNKTVLWSGANNPLWYVQDGIIHEIKANKQPIGKTDNPVAFTTHRVAYKPGTIFYLFTDGYADQFGGEKGKKFKYKNLSELITTNYNCSMQEQKMNLEKRFAGWKGNLEQVDDVCIVGIKL